jgi:hypothetical protein
MNFAGRETDRTAHVLLAYELIGFILIKILLPVSNKIILWIPIIPATVPKIVFI